MSYLHVFTMTSTPASCTNQHQQSDRWVSLPPQLNDNKTKQVTPLIIQTMQSNEINTHPCTYTCTYMCTCTYIGHSRCVIYIHCYALYDKCFKNNVRHAIINYMYDAGTDHEAMAVRQSSVSCVHSDRSKCVTLRSRELALKQSARAAAEKPWPFFKVKCVKELSVWNHTSYNRTHVKVHFARLPPPHPRFILH